MKKEEALNKLREIALSGRLSGTDSIALLDIAKVLEQAGISVPAPGGELAADIASDPDHPGIYLYYRPEAADAYEIDIALAETTDEGNLGVYLWENPDSEDYTKKFVLLEGGRQEAR